VTLGRPEEGWSQARAEAELENVLADVRRGIWKPHLVALPAEPEGPREDPTFHEFATKWFASISKEVRPNTRLDYEWQLRVHLLPFFQTHRLSQITVAEVDRYREAKQAQGPAVKDRRRHPLRGPIKPPTRPLPTGQKCRNGGLAGDFTTRPGRFERPTSRSGGVQRSRAEPPQSLEVAG
jgi:hypothetical protein